MRTLERRGCLRVVFTLVVATLAVEARAFHLEDSLRGSTLGNPVGGVLEEGGWRVTETTDRIWYAIPTLVEGSIEFTLSGVTMENLDQADHEVFTMYEAGYDITEPIVYSPFYRSNHYKHMIRIYGVEEASIGRHGLQKIMWGMCPAGAPGYNENGCACGEAYFQETFGGEAGWDGSPERIRLEWGNGLTRLLRNDVEAVRIDWSDSPYAFGPAELHFTLGSPRSVGADAQNPIGAVYSDLVVDGVEGAPATCGGGGEPIDAGVPVDDAEVVSQDLPTAVACGATHAASVTMRNTGTSTWTRAGGFKLGTVDDADPLFPAGTRVELPEGDSVTPGEEHVFTFTLTAPDVAGTVHTDWRMVHEAVQWFGGIAESDVVVQCGGSSTFAPGSSSPSSSSTASSALAASSSVSPSSSMVASTSSSSSSPASSSSGGTMAVDAGGRSDVETSRCGCAAARGELPVLGAMVLAGLVLARRRQGSVRPSASSERRST